MPTDAFSQEYKGPYNRVVLVNGLIPNPTAVFPDGTMVYDRITRDFYLLAGDWVLLPNLARQYANVASLPLDAPAGSIAITQDDGGMHRFEDGSWVLVNRALTNSAMAGVGAPAADLGIEGDTYIDTATGTLWGPKTEAGWVGNTSLVGPQGETGLPGAGIAWRGAWSAGTAYVEFDGVEHLGSAWVAAAASTGVTPTVAAAQWDLWIQKGEKGDTGDATLPGSVGTTELADGAVTTPKLADFAVTTAKLNIGAVTNDRIGNAAVGESKIEVGAVTGPKIENRAVSNVKFRDSVALSVIGRSVATAGAPGDIAAATDGHVLRRSGTSLAFGTIRPSATTFLPTMGVNAAFYTGRVGIGGADLGKPVGWAYGYNVTTQVYIITHNLNTTSYTVQLTSRFGDGTTVRNMRVTAINNNTFEVGVWDHNGSKTSSEFMFLFIRH